MRYRRADVVDRAIEVLDTYGLGDLSMRRLAAELGVQPSALYHHFADKQTLLAAVADELLTRGQRPRPHELTWDAEVRRSCVVLREAMLAYRDGAELVATTVALGLGAGRPYDDLEAALLRGGADRRLAAVGARALLHYVFGHAVDEQTQLQAASVGAIDDEPREATDFDLGLSLLVDGLRARVGVT